MIYVAEKAFYVSLDYIAIATKLEFEGKVFDCLLRAYPWPVAVTDRVKVLFIDRGLCGNLWVENRGFTAVRPYNSRVSSVFG